MSTDRVLTTVAPTLAFLVAALVLAEACARGGLFAWAAAAVARRSGGRPGLLLAGTMAAALGCTSLLGLDATVLLLTPLVVRAACELRLDPRPVAGACLRVANSGSLLLPVANLTNLLAVPALTLGTARWFVLLAPAQAVILLVEHAALRRGPRATLVAPAHPGATPAAPHATPHTLPAVPAAALLALLAGLLLASRLGLHPWVPASLVAAGAGAWCVTTSRAPAADLLRAAVPGPALALLAWAVVATLLADGPAAGAVARVVEPVVGHAAAGPAAVLGLLLVAALGTAASAALSNIAAALVLVPLVAPAGTVPVLALLVGLDAGAGLTWTGSVATILWWRVLAREGWTVRPAAVHAWWVPTTLLAVAAGTVTLAGTAALLGS